MLLCVFLLITIGTTSVLPRVTESYNSLSCSGVDGTALFNCHDSVNCIAIEKVCDGIKDCDDGSDEELCLYGKSSDNTALHRAKRQVGNCRRNQWECRDRTCISFDGKCDGAVDCPDRSDETLALCRNMPCQGNWFRCTYGACVDGTAPCNGVTDCADNSDELLPRCTNQTMEVQGKFKCKDGTTIDSADLCDGKVDCPDGSDEVIESCADHACPSYLFQCAYGACVDRGSDCDGKQDCADGSDESDDLCNRVGKPSGNGTATGTGTGTGTGTPTPPRPGTCVLPPFPDHGTYTVSNVPNARPGQSSSSYVLTVSCQRGYGLIDADASGRQMVYCVSGVWYSSMPTCVRFCKLKPDLSVRYMCQVPNTDGFKTCGTSVAPGTNVKPICNSPNYYSPEALAYMKCIDGSFDKVTICKPECGRVTPEGVQLVAGGTYAKRGEVPWHIGIYRKTVTPYMQICGGSLVSNDVVISAAHCFWNDVSKKQPASDYAAAAGKLYRPWNDKHDDAQKSDIKDIHIPSLFQGAQANFQEDIAVVILVTPFVYKTYIRPVCLNFDIEFERRQLVPNNYGKVAGWGLTGPDGKASPILKVVDLPYVSPDDCINILPPSFREYITGDKFCAGYTNGTSLCQGDSGGGLAFVTTELSIDRYYLRGVVSTAPSTEDKCNVYSLTTFTRITKHDDFLKEYI